MRPGASLQGEPPALALRLTCVEIIDALIVLALAWAAGMVWAVRGR